MNRILRMVVLALLASVPVEAAPPPRTLFIMLDSVPYGLVVQWMDPERAGGPVLPGFKGPVPVISTFPSSTSVASVGLFGPLGLERSPGYEARFFDWRERRARGGGALSYFRIDFPWRDFFSWTKKGVVRSSVAALRPISASVGRSRLAIEAFRASDRREFFVYIETTDLISHLKGPKQLLSTFVELDREIRRARREEPDRPFSVVLFADHGISGGKAPLRNVWAGVGEALKGAGYRKARRLRGPRDVVLTPFGLVSSFEVYTQDEKRHEVADLLSRVDGVEVCVSAESDGWRVVAQGAEARIGLRSRDDAWSYQPRAGDPLRLAGAVEALRERAASPEATWFPDRWWFEATTEAHYPDPLYRLARSFDLVDNPASVLCSVAEGHLYGLASAERTSRITTGALRWTHGSLRWEPTVTFLLSDRPDWQPAGPVRFDEALRPFTTLGSD